MPPPQVITLASFVRRHQVDGSDSLPKLAVQYALDIHTLKRLNNLMSDGALQSRDYVYAPGTCVLGGGGLDSLM